MNLGKVSNSTFPKWKMGTVGNELQILLLNVDGDVRKTPNEELRGTITRSD
jgi:hypothetical protein